MMAKTYTHVMDLCFEVNTDEPDPDKIGKDTVLVAILRRLVSLTDDWDGDAVGFVDSYGAKPLKLEKEND